MSDPSTPAASLAEGPSSGYYSAMSEPAMVSWSTGEVRRMRSVLEMRLGVLACGSLDRSSLMALRAGDDDAAAAAAYSPLSLSPASLRGPAARARSARKSRSGASSATSNRSGVGSAPDTCSPSPAATPSRGSSASSSSLSSALASTPPPSRAPSSSSPPPPPPAGRSRIPLGCSDRVRLLFDVDDDDDDDNDGENAGETHACSGEVEQYESSSDEEGIVDVFGIRIPGSGRRQSGGDCVDEGSREENEDAVGLDEDECDDDETDFGNVRRHLLPQLVAFVAESPSKLDLSGLLC